MFDGQIIYRVRHGDIYRHLATEEFLLNNVKENQRILYLWYSDNAVVFGKNQNPWVESNIPALKIDNIQLARRLSGGGTVYHDSGNLNFTFISRRPLFNVDRHIHVVVSALSKLGIPAQPDVNHSLTIQGRKFSGNAFCFRKKKAFHHGTILVNVNLEKLDRNLQGGITGMEMIGVPSKCADVINLTDVKPSLKFDNLIDEIIQSFINEYPDDSVIIRDELSNVNDIDILYDKYSTWDWIFGQTPNFRVRWLWDSVWGGAYFVFNVKKGRITGVSIESETLDSFLISHIIQSLNGCRFESDDIVACLDIDGNRGRVKSQLKEIANWIKQQHI